MHREEERGKLIKSENHLTFSRLQIVPDDASSAQQLHSSFVMSSVTAHTQSRS